MYLYNNIYIYIYIYISLSIYIYIDKECFFTDTGIMQEGDAHNAYNIISDKLEHYKLGRYWIG